ncbi:MAG: hypothetical protein ABI707_04385 [Ferruginibacter sp.]
MDYLLMITLYKHADNERQGFLVQSKTLFYIFSATVLERNMHTTAVVCVL